MPVSDELFFTLMIAGMIERRLGFDVDIRLKLGLSQATDTVFGKLIGYITFKR